MVEAYDRLVAEGVVQSRGGHGGFLRFNVAQMQLSEIIADRQGA